jgi:curved DNA-binding protein
MASYKDYYSILGVPKTATQKEIRAAYRKLAAKHHPDRNPGDKAAEDRFKEVGEAYAVLSDEEKRRYYDQFGTAEGRPPFSGGYAAGGQVNPEDLGDFSDFFQTLFGSGGFARGQVRSSFFTSGGRGGGSAGDPFSGFQQRPTVRDIEGSITVSLEDAYHGATTTITVDGKRIEVKLPKGTRDGSRIRLRGQAPGGGDLYLTIRHEGHPRFNLDGDNVHVHVNVPDHTAVLGGNVRVPTLDGEVEMTLPPRTQSGRTLRLRGQGWPRRDGTRGDELAEVRISIPETPSEEQLELYRKLRELADTRAETVS